MRLQSQGGPFYCGAGQVVYVRAHDGTKIGHSGAFEVYVEEELVHSKLNGQGYVNEEKLKAIAAFVSERLKK